MPQTIAHELEALGTHWQIEFATDNANATGVISKLEELIRAFEDDYSRFLPESKLSVLNQTGVCKKPAQEFSDMLQYGLDLYRVTNKQFDMSIGSVLESKGYGRSAEGATQSTNLAEDLIITQESIRLAPNRHLDLGGFGKGWLVDKLAKHLASQGITDYVINGGGDILAGLQPKTLYIRDPQNHDQYIEELTLQSCALAGSSSLGRTWLDSANTQHSHISSVYSSDILSSHVIAPTALVADSYATIVQLVSYDAAIELAKTQKFEFMIVYKDRTSVRTQGFGSNS